MNKLTRLKRCKRCISTLMLMCCSLLVWAQNTVTGTVLDESNLEVIGANVKEKGTANGAITDMNGVFHLKVSNLQKAVLQISFMGYEPQEVPLNGRKQLKIILKETANELQEVTVVAYGTQKKETLTGAISAVSNDALVRSPNASVANTLAGQITGLSSVQTSGQPGQEDPKVFIRGVGSLTESASSPLILVDGVERSFYQMDPNEIESVTVLKDASATAVFGVRGANGVILVTTRRGKEGKAKISVNSSVGIQMPTRMLEMADSYTYATLRNEIITNDKPNATENDLVFDNYAVERFRLNDDPIMYPSIDWRRYLLNKTSVQTQHNLNISGGTKDIRYFISLGFLYQNGLLKQFEGVGYDNNYKYKRYNYRANLDFDATKTTTLKIGIGGIVGNRNEPMINDATNSIWTLINQTTPFSSPGVIDGKLIVTPEERFDNKINLGNSALPKCYGTGYSTAINNTMNLDLLLNQKLDFITKGLSAEIKGAYNTSYGFTKKRKGQVEQFMPFYQSSLEDPSLGYDSPDFNKNIVYKIKGENKSLQYDETSSRARDWYLEASLRYNRKFGFHNVGGLFLYNQSKKYYPAQWVGVPSAYIGFVGRLTYDYKSRYMAEVNFGYNGSENFAPGKRFGLFPAVSAGWVLTEENFMQPLKPWLSYFKLRASYGVVGNDRVSGNYRFLYLPDSYNPSTGSYYFGNSISTAWQGAVESKIGNPDVTWETAAKQNYGVDAYFINSKLKVNFDYFIERRKDILTNRKVLPTYLAANLPIANIGKVDNKGYELSVNWRDRIHDFRYHIGFNLAYAKNKIVFQDEVPYPYDYMRKTGKPVGQQMGYKYDGFFSEEDVAKYETERGKSIPDHGTGYIPKPGDVKYKDLNNDHKIDQYDVAAIGYPVYPLLTGGINLGFSYKGFDFSMTWSGATKVSRLLDDIFREPFGATDSRSLMKYMIDDMWTPEKGNSAKAPAISFTNKVNNYRDSDLWLRDASYLRLKNVEIGYNFPKKILSKINIGSLRVFATGYNLLTLDKLKIVDPESRPNGNAMYPVVMVINMGLKVGF